MGKIIMSVLLSGITFTNYRFGQELLNRLNSLPPTTVQRAPEFDVEKKYIFSIDSINNLLFVQDFGRKPDSREEHPIQTIFEIPLSDLNVGSFLVSKGSTNIELSLSIGTTNNKTSIIQYWLRNDQIVAIMAHDVLRLGTWIYTDMLELELLKISKQFADMIPNKSGQTKFSGMKSIYKYASEKAIAIGQKDTVKELNSGYYYVSSLKNPSYYADKKDFESSNIKLLRDLKTELKKVTDISSGPDPVFVNVSNTGTIESIFFLNQTSNVNRKIDLNSLKTFNPGNDGAQNIRSKILLIIR